MLSVFKATIIMALSSLALQAQAQQQQVEPAKPPPSLIAPREPAGQAWTPPPPAEHDVSWYLGNLEQGLYAA